MLWIIGHSASKSFIICILESNIYDIDNQFPLPVAPIVNDQGHAKFADLEMEFGVSAFHSSEH